MSIGDSYMKSVVKIIAVIATAITDIFVALIALANAKSSEQEEF